MLGYLVCTAHLVDLQVKWHKPLPALTHKFFVMSNKKENSTGPRAPWILIKLNFFNQNQYLFPTEHKLFQLSLA